MFARYMAYAVPVVLAAFIAAVMVDGWHERSGESQWNDVNGMVAQWLEAEGNTAKAKSDKGKAEQTDVSVQAVSTEQAGSGRAVNINEATIDELDSLPGIGAAKAGAIKAFREKNGPFRRIEDIMEVNGIGEGIFAKLKERITVSSTESAEK